MVSRFTWKCDFLCARKKCVVFQQAVSSKLMCSKYDVKVANTEFHISRKIHVESTHTRVFIPLSKVWVLLPLFTEIVNAESQHGKIFCTEIHPHRSRNMEIHFGPN
jgi:hypothetical protein